MSASSSSSGDSAQNRFGGAKSISSDQYFNRDRVDVRAHTHTHTPCHSVTQLATLLLFLLRKEKAATADFRELKAFLVMIILVEKLKVSSVN